MMQSVPSWILVIESILMATTLAGLVISLMLTVDSGLRYVQVKELVQPHNYFPLMHLRIDICFFLVQVCLGAVSFVWLEHLIAREPSVLEALTHLWLVFPLRLFLVILLCATQGWNAWDRHRMSFVEDIRSGQN